MNRYRIALAEKDFRYLGEIGRRARLLCHQKPEMRDSLVNVSLNFRDPPEHTIVAGPDSEGIRSLMNLVFDVTSRAVQFSLETDRAD